MSITDEQALIEFVKDLMGGSSEKVSSDGFQKAVIQATSELNWTLPTNDSFKDYWFVERTKRYVTFILLFESAHKFKYKQISLQHRFEHYKAMLEMMDEQFKDAIEANPTQFDTSVGTTLCFYLTNGFQYDSDGEWMR